MPQNPVGRQTVYDTWCILHIAWSNPKNMAAEDVSIYIISINGTNTHNETSNLTVTVSVYHVCQCASHNVSITAMNKCGHVGSTARIVLHPDKSQTEMCDSTCSNASTGNYKWSCIFVYA